MTDIKDLLVGLQNTNKQIEKADPEFYTAFKDFAHEAEKEGALSVKTKQLIAIALGVSTHCSTCIARHVEKAALVGATRQEIAEAGIVAVLMGGGPCVSYMRYVFETADALGLE